MSHLVKMKSSVKVTDLNLLEESCKKMGLVLHKEKKVATYYAGNTTKCDAVISCPGSTYEIALNRQADGSYEMQADLFDGKLKTKVGADCGLLYQRYKAEEVSELARLENWSVTEQYNPETQVLELVLDRP